MLNKIPLVIAYGQIVQEQLQALIDGKVRIENCNTKFALLARGEMLFRSFYDPEFNIAELSLSNYVSLRDQGNCPYVVMPVYIARSFRHADIYIRTDRNINAPHDLRGRRIGIAEYQHTAYVWVRGMLEDEYGVKPSDIKWVSVCAEKNEHPEDTVFRLPPGVSVEEVDATSNLSDMLERGEIDALISARVPDCYKNRAANISRLFADHHAAEEDYFKRSGVFPILHLMGIRNELVMSHPELAHDVYKAFLASRNLAFTPVAASAEQPTDMDRHSYGLGARDHNTLDLFLGYHHKQGLSSRRYKVEELFAPVSLDGYR